MTTARHEAAESITWASRRLLAIAFITLIYCAIFWRSGLQAPDPTSSLIYFRNFTRGEPLIGLAFVVWLAWNASAWITKPTESARVFAEPFVGMWRVRVPSIVLLGLLPPLLAGTFVGRGFPIAMDEYGSWLQARLVRDGTLVGRLPQSWVSFRDSLTPVFVQSGSSPDTWVLSYLPGYSVLLAAADAAHLISWLNPILNAVALIALWGVARHRWPGDAETQTVAVLALALSTQFQLAGTTLYSMPAHLAFNMVWLWGYTRGGAARLIMGPVGFFASILHQPIPHPLFALPFLFRMVRKREWSMLGYLSGWYLAAIVVFIAWSGLGGGANGAPFGIPSTANFTVLAMHVITILTWQTPVTGLLLLISLRRWSLLDEVDHDLFGGLAISLVLYLFFVLVTQGHGYGWRYGHQVLGNLALLAATSWRQLRESLDAPRLRALVVSSVLVTCIVQVPWRTIQAAKISRPFIAAHQWLAGQTSRVVLVPTDSLWYGRDLIRNTPDLRTPILMHAQGANSVGLRSIFRTDSLTVRRVSVEELEALGLERLPTGRSR
jgi:hypothetical protein